MNVWSAITFILINLYFAYFAYKKRGVIGQPYGIIRFLFFPVLCPIVLFDFGYFLQAIFVPSIFIANPVVTFWWPFILLTLLSLTAQSVLTIIFKVNAVEVWPETVSEIIRSRNRSLLAVGYAAGHAVQPALSEELWFRYFLMVVFQVLLIPVILFLNLHLMIPHHWLFSWLSLGVQKLLAPTVFLVLFTINLIFAILHMVEPSTKKLSVKLLVRGIGAWFMSWILTLALLETGLIGAIGLHFLVNFILFVPLLVYKFEEVAKEFGR